MSADPDSGPQTGTDPGTDPGTSPDPGSGASRSGEVTAAGSKLLELVAVMDRLRRECPWVQEQTHRSLVRYLLEEAYEAIEALDSGSMEHAREELGDLLFQVVFHARIAAEHPIAPWTIDDVAAGLVDKLVRRNPHVFAGAQARDVREIEAVWDQTKAAEKVRNSPVDGVPLALPALALADKVLARAEQAGHPDPTADAEQAPSVGPLPERPDADQVGASLLATVAAARRGGVDPEQALRDAVRRLVDGLGERA